MTDRMKLSKNQGKFFIPFVEREGLRFPLLRQVSTIVRSDMLELASKNNKQINKQKNKVVFTM